MGRLTRGIIGQKPTTTGLTTYSDVFGLDTQFSEQISGTWPTGSGVSGNYKFLCMWNSLATGQWFSGFQKMSNSLYYPSQPLYSGPDIVTAHTTFDTTNPTALSATPGLGYIAMIGSTRDGGTTATQWFNIFLYKKASNYSSEFQYVTTLTSVVDSSYWPAVLSFNPAGTILAVGWNGSSSTTTGAKFTAYSRSGDTFTGIGGITDVNASQSAVVSQVVWNRQGTSVAVIFGVTPFIAIYNVSGTTFTKLTTPATGPSSATVFGMAWNHDGSSLAVYYSTNTLLIYNRSGDTFTALPTITVTTGAGSYRRSMIDWNHDGTLLAVCGTTGMQVFSRSGDTFTSLTLPTLYRTNLISCSFSADGKELIYSGGGVIEIFDVNGTTITRPTTYKFGALPGIASYATLDYFQSASPTSANFANSIRQIVMLR